MPDLGAAQNSGVQGLLFLGDMDVCLTTEHLNPAVDHSALPSGNH